MLAFTESVSNQFRNSVTRFVGQSSRRWNRLVVEGAVYQLTRPLAGTPS